LGILPPVPTPGFLRHGQREKGEIVDTRTAYREHLKEMNVLASAMALLNWDQETHMPPKGIGFRAQVMGRLAKRLFQLSISPELGTMLETLGNDTTLSPEETASVRELQKQYTRQKAIPPALIEEHATVRSQAQAAWAEARRNADFSQFEPWLGKMVAYARRFADYYGYEDHPYDGLLEDYEPGMTVRKLQEIIDPLREQLVPFLQRLQADGTPPDLSPIRGTYAVDRQRELARRALECIGYDFQAGRLDDVAHPFTIGIAHGDIRVTNRYLEDHITSGLYGALHEGGHALYGQGMPDELFALHLANGASNGIHESQSRIIENQLGRGLPFWQFFQPILAEILPAFGSVTPEALYHAVNEVTPSFIRVEADEVTYNLHIMLRAELETGLIAGEIEVSELPERWNEAMQRYLGITPPDAAQGVLQDVHWSVGYFGYFPSYMLGNLYAAQMAAKMREDLPDLDERLAAGDLAAMVNWLREHVHRHGGVVRPDELIQRISGRPLDPSYFMKYVEAKYGEIYGVTGGRQ
jgi:carboxypeptidase Taq